jgi:site-specific recombinase XerD
MMGHASIEFTEIYTHVAIAELKKAHQCYHPVQLPEAVSHPTA